MRTKRRFAKRRTRRLPDRTMPPPAEAGSWSVYVLSDEAGRAFSVSMARDVTARAYRHRQAVETLDQPKRRTPILVYVEPFACRHTALAKMKRMRLWTTAELRRAIAEANPTWSDLYVDPFETPA